MAGQHWFERAHDAVVQLASEGKIFVCRSLFEQLTKRQHLLAQPLFVRVALGKFSPP
jgi:hypothetical protein